MFIKGVVGGTPWPCTQLSLSTDANNAEAAVGSMVKVTIKALGLDADCLCSEIGCCSEHGRSLPNPGLCQNGCNRQRWCCATDGCCLDNTGTPQGGTDVCCKDIWGADVGNCQEPVEGGPSTIKKPLGNPGAQQPAISAKGGSKSHVTPPATADKPGQRTLARQRAADTLSDLLKCVGVALQISGNAEWMAVGVPPGGFTRECEFYGPLGASSNITTGLREPSARQTSSSPTQLIVVPTDTNAGATVWLLITGKGPINVSVLWANGRPLNTNYDVSITGISPSAVPGAVAKLKLQPSKSHKHCGDLATIIATAKDANGAAVAGAKVTFSAGGDCHIYNSQEVKTTDVNGIATYSFGAYDPCKASVVAASAGANGAMVLSDVSYVYFVEGHGPEEREDYHGDEKEHYGDEREYYRG